MQDAAVLAEEVRLPAEERAVLTIAAGAHDVVYDGHPGDDERRSASWARRWLARAGVGEAQGHRLALAFKLALRPMMRFRSRCRQALQGGRSRSALSWKGESGYDQSWTRSTEPIGLAGSSARRR